MSGSIDGNKQQDRVVNAPADDDVLVVAGAGSGKTYTMTRRIIALIRRGVAPERILGLTFTRKAAGELLERVSAAVAEDSSRDGGDRLFLKPAIYTYDAFFQTIVRQYGLLVGFDQNTQPLSVAGSLQLISNVVERHIGDIVDSTVDTGSFAGLTQHVLQLSNAIGGTMIGSGCDNIDDAIARIRAWDGAFAARIGRAIGDEQVPESQPSIGRRPRRGKNVTDAAWQNKLDEFRTRLHDNCLWQCARLLRTTEKRELLLGLVAEYAAEKRRLNMAEFSDFTIAAYQLITRFPSIGRRYRTRFSHVLLDEYQDTSTTQATLIAALFHAGDGHGDERCAVNAVGDPFQSIYAWRGASPGAFRMFQRDFGMSAGERPYALTVTRRNSRVVLEAANNLTMPLRDDSPRRPSSSPMHEVDVAPLGNLPDAPLGTIGVLGYDTLGQQIDGVVRFCREAIRANSHASGDGHRGTVAVLFRTKQQMSRYQQALEQAGLTTFVVGYSALFERPEIRDLMALLHVVADHTDSASLMRLLATPRFHLAAEELRELARLAEQANCAEQFRALVEAGVADADAPRETWDRIVHDHRDMVGNTVFLADLLQRDDFDDIVARSAAFSRESLDGVRRMGAMLRDVRSAVGRPLADVVRTAVQALDLDIDTVVAQALRGDDAPVNPTVAHMPMDGIIDLVDTYASEIAADSTPTLRGFVSWTDALDSVEDEAMNMRDDRADVELMTIHQSKGLEWDAVAVVDMTDGVFPSRQGDNLHIARDEDRAGGLDEHGVWRAPEYRETAKSWLEVPTAVPVPVRVDAAILPQFPHDAPVGGDPVAALSALDDVEQIDDEVFGSMRQFGDGVDDVDRDGWYLTQQEEYGRRLHADERRIAYVALTRARHDALLTFCRTGEESRDPALAHGAARRASNFWQEVHDSMHARRDATHEPANIDADVRGRIVQDIDAYRAAVARASQDAEDGDGVVVDALPPLPEGFCAGERAQDYMNAIVGDAWMTPIPDRAGDTGLAWPATLSEPVMRRLQDGARAVLALLDGDGRESDERTAGTDFEADGIEREHGLLALTRMVVDDADLMHGVLEGEALDRVVRERARRIIGGRRQSVTSLQAIAGGLSDREERSYWRGIVRPVPSVASPAAESGTIFHAWAQRFIMAARGDADAEHGGILSRRAMLEDLRRAEASASDNPGVPRNDLLVWQRRLADSRWASRDPAWAERQIVASIPQLNGAIVNGKLDAVFFGGLDDDEDVTRYTIVDWKTGRRPGRQADAERKLVQLDLYRLLLSAIEGIPLDSIDATLYYLSEPDESRRELRAREKTEQEILDELHRGIPEQSDDD